MERSSALVERVAKLLVSKVYVDKSYGYVAETTAEKAHKCALCGCREKDGEKLVKGAKRITVATSSDCKHYHIGCYRRKISATDTDSVATNYSAKSTRNHNVVVVVPSYEVGFYLENDLEVTRCIGSNTEVAFLEERNRHRSGHILPTLWERGLKVKVNGMEVANWEELDMVTR